MDIDSQKCPDCGKPFQSPAGAEAVCECSNSPKHQPIQPELEILAPLPCPKCGHQKHATASMIGKPENCQCGYQFRYTLVLSPIRHESLAWIPSVKRRVTVGCRKSVYWWRQSAIPWMNRTATYVRRHVIPRIVNISKSRCKWLTVTADSFFNPVPSGKPQNGDALSDSSLGDITRDEYQKDSQSAAIDAASLEAGLTKSKSFLFRNHDMQNELLMYTKRRDRILILAVLIYLSGPGQSHVGVGLSALVLH